MSNLPYMRFRETPTTAQDLSELRGYAPPTWKQYDRSADQWAEWKRQAAVLPESELRRHASVSTSNRHHCVDCFCCAALAVLQEIECGPNGGKRK